MDESSPIRAIAIGAGVLITIATITAVLTYYNTSKEMVRSIGTGTDIGQEYATYVEDMLLVSDTKGTIYGSDVKNLLNYFLEEETVEIDVENLAPLYNGEGKSALNEEVRISAKNVNNDKSRCNDLLKKISPNQRFKLSKKVEDGKMYITLVGQL